MMSDRNRRLAQRHEVQTTPIRWRVAKRRRNGAAGRVVTTDAAVVEVSSVGAGIVCPREFIAPVGTLAEISYRGMTGFVLVRRAEPIPGADHLVRYGVEYVTTSANTIGVALHELAEPQVQVDATGRTPIAWEAPRP
ncbi:MAG: hypothetical protein R2702_15050 [Acidimicrobiales bacterium]